MRTLLAIGMIFVCAPAIAGPQCTDEPQGTWLSETEMMQRIDAMGYQVDVFKTTEGNCYEIYGRDVSGKRVEVYFHPVTGVVVRLSTI